jgi:hypothetical protein
MSWQRLEKYLLAWPNNIFDFEDGATAFIFQVLCVPETHGAFHAKQVN